MTASLKNMKSLFKIIAVLSATIALLLPQLAAADVNDFSFESFDANYHLSVNEQSDNRSEGWGFESLQAHVTQFLFRRSGSILEYVWQLKTSSSDCLRDRCF